MYRLIRLHAGENSCWVSAPDPRTALNFARIPNVINWLDQTEFYLENDHAKESLQKLLEKEEIGFVAKRMKSFTAEQVLGMVMNDKKVTDHEGDSWVHIAGAHLERWPEDDEEEEHGSQD